LTNIVPVAGFRQEELDFSWSPDGSYILYPFFDRLYRVNLDNSGEIEVYTTPDGSLISEVDIQDLDEDVILLKTNNLDGYEARIFTIRLSTQTIQTIILEGVPGAAGGAQISANGNIVLYNRDIDETEVPDASYRIFNSRIFVFNMASGTSNQVDTTVVTGENDLDPRFSPTEGAIIFTRVQNNEGAIPSVYIASLSTTGDLDDDELFTAANMPDFE